MLLTLPQALPPSPVSTLREVPRTQAWSQRRMDALATAMPGLMARHHVPGVALALVEGARIRWVRGFGALSPGGEAVTGETVFQGASLAKPLTALLTARLAEKEGWLLEAKLRDLAPDLSPLKGALGDLTVAQVLSHSAGITWNDQTHGLETREAGTWRYSTPGYALLQRVLEARSGKDLQQLEGETVLGPLGLGRTAFIHGAIPGPLALGHDREGKAMRAALWERPHGGSSLLTTASDYGAFLAAFLRAKAPLTPTLRDRLVAPRVPVSSPLGLSWGLGWALERRGARTCWFHWGSNPGFKSFALVDPGRDLGLVILTNGDSGLELAEAMVGRLDPEPHPLFRFYMLHPDD